MMQMHYFEFSSYTWERCVPNGEVDQDKLNSHPHFWLRFAHRAVKTTIGFAG
jgi:hypothetical protein